MNSNKRRGVSRSWTGLSFLLSLLVGAGIPRLIFPDQSAREQIVQKDTANEPRLILNPTSLVFNLTRANPLPGPLHFEVRNSGGGALHWIAFADVRWLTISPVMGFGEGAVEVSLDPDGLSPGLHKAKIRIHARNAANSPQSVEVTVMKESFYAGFRASRYGITPFPEPAYWERVSKSMASRFSGALPAGVWIVGVALDEGGCQLNFPSPGGLFADTDFLDTDQNEEYLRLFDTQNISVWLQVEPGKADIATLIELVLSRYAHHPCVRGFGVDAEWYLWQSYEYGKDITDTEAMSWSEKVRSYNPSYQLFLKHWIPGRMPPTYREGLFFIDDSQQFDSPESMVGEFKAWGEYFSPSPVGFQFGYEADEFWWQRFSDPPRVIGNALVDEVPNIFCLFWVDFTLEKVFPRASNAIAINNIKESR